MSAWRHFPHFSAALLVGLLVLACREEKYPLQAQEDCKSADVVNCLQQYTCTRMGNSAVERLITKGIGECFSSDRRERDLQARTCLPLAVGTDRQGRELEAHYRCDHACPDQGHIWIRYAKDPGLDGCCKRDGFTIRSGGARGVYIDCAPAAYFRVFEGMPNVENYSMCDTR